MPRITNVELGRILELLDQGLSQREIAEKMSIPQCTISRAVKKYKKFGSLEHLGGNGRAPVVSAALAECIDEQVAANPMTSLRKVVSKVASMHGTGVSHMTVKRYLNGKDINAHVPLCKPLLTPRHIQTRLEAANLWLCLTDNELQSIVFSDESKFNIRYSDGQVFVWRGRDSAYESRHIHHTVKFGGGSVMVWSCFSYHGVGRLVFIDETMDAGLYVSILASSLPPSLEKMGLSSFIFQQDNDPKHTSTLAKGFMNARSIKRLPWPAQSPDLNPIENLWGIVKRRVAEKQPKNINELKVAIEEAWYSIPVETCQKLAMSFRKRALSLRRARGRYTKY